MWAVTGDLIDSLVDRIVKCSQVSSRASEKGRHGQQLLAPPSAAKNSMRVAGLMLPNP